MVTKQLLNRNDYQPARITKARFHWIGNTTLECNQSCTSLTFKVGITTKEPKSIKQRAPGDPYQEHRLHCQSGSGIHSRFLPSTADMGAEIATTMCRDVSVDRIVWCNSRTYQKCRWCQQALRSPRAQRSRDTWACVLRSQKSHQIEQCS